MLVFFLYTFSDWQNINNDEQNKLGLKNTENTNNSNFISENPMQFKIIYQYSF